MTRRHLLVVVSVMFIVTPALRAAVYLHPSWAGRPKSECVLAVFPATFDIKTETAGGRSLRREESQVVETQLARYVIGALQAQGWTIADDAFRREDMAQNRELLYLVSYLRERHATLAQRIMTAPKEIKAGRVSFGDAVTGVRAYTRANILVFVYVEGFDYTAAARVLGIAATVAFEGPVGLALRDELFKGRQIRIRVSFVDALTGDVLCFIRPGAMGEAAFLKELGKLR